MPTLDGFALPPEIVEELKRLAASTPGEELEGFLLVHPELAKGGGRREAQIENARRHLAWLASGDREIDAGARSILAGQSLYQRFLIVLSEEAIERAWDLLCGWFGEARFLAATLLDARQAVRARARMELANRGSRPWREPDPSAAAGLKELLHPFLKELGDLVSPRPASSEGASPRSCDDGRAAELAKRLEVAERRLAKRDEEAKELQRERDEARRAGKALEKEGRTTREAAARRESEFQAEVERRVAEEMEARIRAYLGPAVERERRIASRRDGDLAARAEAALAAAAGRGRDGRTLAELERKLAEMEALRERVRGAVAASADPPDDLLAVAGELEAAVSELRAAAGRTGESDLPSRVRRAAQGMKAEDLAKLRRFLEEARHLGCLAEEEEESIDAFLRRRVALLTDPMRSAAGREKTAVERNVLERALEGEVPLLLIVDGHNVARTELARRLPPETGETALREELARRIVEALDGRSTIDCRLFFDGSAAGTRTAAPNVIVQYSGGAPGTSDRADAAIASCVEFQRAENRDAAILVVSEDRGVGAQARAHRARVLFPFEFLETLERAARRG